MAIHKSIHAYIWDFIPPTMASLMATRNSLPTSNLDDVRAGLNYSILLISACYVEGALETGLKGILQKKHLLYHELEKNDFNIRKTLNIFTNKLHEDLEQRIGRTTGAEGYSEMFELVVGTPLNQFDKIKPMWEGIRVLFHFRNMIAHGRRIEIDYTLSGMNGKTEVWVEEFSGGYSKVEEYLLKRSLIGVKFGEQESAWYFFSDAIADHFWNLAEVFISTVSDSLSEIDQTAFLSALHPTHQ